MLPLLCSGQSADSQNSSTDSLKLFSSEINLDGTSKYIWRDFAFGYTAFQPNIDMALNGTGFSLNFWQSIGQGETGLDLQTASTIKYTCRSCEKVQASVGFIYYLTYEPQFQLTPDTISITGLRHLLARFQEVFFTVGFSSIVNTELVFFYSNERELYGTISLSKSLYESERVVLSTTGNIGYRINGSNNTIVRDIRGELELRMTYSHVEPAIFLSGTHLPGRSGILPQFGIRINLK